MAEAQFTPGPSVDTFATAMTAANTMSSLFERAQRMRMEAVKAQQAQELHQMSVQSKQLGLQRDAQLFETEKLNLQKQVKLAQQESNNQARLDMLEMSVGDDLEAFNLEIQNLLAPSELHGELIPFDRKRFGRDPLNSRSVIQLQSRLDELRQKYKPLLESGTPQAMQVQAKLFSAADSLTPLALQVREATDEMFHQYSAELIRINADQDSTSARNQLVAIQQKYADLASRDPARWKEYEERTLKHIKDLETAEAKEKAATMSFLNKQTLQRESEEAKRQLEILKQSYAQRDAEADAMPKLKVAQAQQDLQHEKKKLERLLSYLYDSSKAQERTVEYRQATNPKAIAQRATRRLTVGDQLPDGVNLMAEFSGNYWLEKVQQLKGALSDNEGKKLAEMSLGTGYSDAQWIIEITQMLQIVDGEINDAKNKNKWYVNDDGSANLSTANAAPTPPQTPTPISQEEVSNALNRGTN
jgi:hypothetical protein